MHRNNTVNIYVVLRIKRRTWTKRELLGVKTPIIKVGRLKSPVLYNLNKDCSEKKSIECRFGNMLEWKTWKFYKDGMRVKSLRGTSAFTGVEPTIRRCQDTYGGLRMK